MNSLWEESEPFCLPNTQYSVIGKSTASICTSFYIPELRIMFDCGVSHNFVPEHVFITHGHLDHTKAIAETIVQQGNTKAKIKIKPNIFIPSETEQFFKEAIHHIFVLSKHNPTHKMNNKFNLVSSTENMRIDVVIKNTPWIVEIFKCYHTTPCVGYGLIEKRQKLKEEYKNLTGQELGNLKKQNIQITEEKEYPILCFLGDTTIEVFKNNNIFKYPIIFTECTFFEENLKKLAWTKKHTLWSDLIKIINKHPDNFFIIYHFSNRYKDIDIKTLIDDIPTNVFFWQTKKN